MNTFDYWFDYIVRNGEFLGKRWSYLSYEYTWRIKTKRFSYFAYFEKDENQTKTIFGKFNRGNRINFMLYKDDMTNFYLPQKLYRELINHRNEN